MRVFRKLQPRDLDFAAVVKKAEFDPIGMSREDGEASAFTIVVCSELEAPAIISQDDEV